MVDNNLIMAIQDLDIKQYLENNGAHFIRKGNFIISKCLFHNDNSPSMFIKDNKFKCFSCGVTGDIIDACKLLNNISFPKACELLEEYSQGKIINSNSKNTNNYQVEKFNKEAYKKEQQAQEQKRKNRFKALLLNANNLDKETEEYFKNRNLLEIVKKVNSNDKIPLNIKMNLFNNNKTILYIFNKHNLIIQKGIKKDSNNKKFVCNVGNSRPIPLIINKNDNRITIVEGIEDALSSLAMNRNSIVLNGVGNTRKLIECLNLNKSWSSTKEFIILTDLDNAGKQALSYLEAELSNLNYKYTIPVKMYELMKKNNFKDLNDYYKNQVIKRC